MKKGTLEAIVGCMSSGKSEELIRRLRRAEIAKLRVALFKPRSDTRTDEFTVASRDGRKYPAMAVADPQEILDWVDRENFSGIVALDEAQFFAPSILRVVDGLIDRGLRVIAAGLDTDFRGLPFEPVPQLLAVADSVTKLTAVCVCCGATATRSQIKAAPPEGEHIRVGGDELYEARCRDCHQAPQ